LAGGAAVAAATFFTAGAFFAAVFFTAAAFFASGALFAAAWVALFAAGLTAACVGALLAGVLFAAPALRAAGTTERAPDRAAPPAAAFALALRAADSAIGYPHMQNGRAAGAAHSE
jgi:hypothetical protein